MRTIRIIMPYFGQWPVWFPLFLETCRWNQTIEWYFFSDCPKPVSAPPNTVFLKTTLAELAIMIATKLELADFKLARPYKLCDLRPAFGVIFEDYLRGIDFWGHGDLDVVYGDLRGTFTPDVLEYNIISMFRRFISGHLALYRNSEQINNMFRIIPNWRELFRQSENHRVDEDIFCRYLGIDYFTRPVPEREWFGSPLRLGSGYYFHESWNTPRFYLNNPLSLRRARWRGCRCNRLWRGQGRVPDVWYWEAGRLTNNVDTVELPYLHFMHWVREDWRALNKILRGSLNELHKGFRVERGGFFPLEAESLSFSQGVQLSMSKLKARLATRSGRLGEKTLACIRLLSEGRE